MDTGCCLLYYLVPVVVYCTRVDGENCSFIDPGLKESSEAVADKRPFYL